MLLLATTSLASGGADRREKGEGQNKGKWMMGKEKRVAYGYIGRRVDRF